MGAIPSVSLPAVVTCRQDCGCCKICYARKIERLRPNVRACYQENLIALKESPNAYFREVEGAIMASRFFRWHVSGDIVDVYYLSQMVRIAERNPHCEMLCFTKRYDFVNEYLDSGGKIPQNLHLIFSGWRGLKMENPYRLPEAHVLYKDGYSTAVPTAKRCGGNCTECAISNGGCWSLKSGEQIVFNEH